MDTVNLSHDLLERYVSSLRGDNMSPTTIDQYVGNLVRVDTYLKLTYTMSLYKNFTLLNKEHLISFLATIQHLTASTINSYIWAMRSFFGFLIDNREISADFNPALSLAIYEDRRDPREREERYYQDDDVRALLTSFNTAKRRYWQRDLAIVALILGSGLRASEACSLRIMDYAEFAQSGKLYCKRKGGRICKVEVASYVQGYIDEYLSTRDDYSANDPLFLSQKGGSLNRKALWSSLSGYQHSVGVDTGIHILRHCFLTAIRENTDIYTAAVAANHRSPQTTIRYDHSDTVRKAVNGTKYAEMLG